MKNKILIESDGTTAGTKIIVNGKPLEGVTRVEFIASENHPYVSLNVDYASIGCEQRAQILNLGGDLVVNSSLDKETIVREIMDAIKASGMFS